MLVLKGLVGLYRTVKLQLLQRYWLGHRLGLLWDLMVCLGNEQRSFYHFWDCIQVLHFGLFCWPWWLLHFFWGIWGQEKKGMTEDEMARWHYWLDGRESEWILGIGDGQRGLACCDSWGRKESDMAERLNWTELKDLRDIWNARYMRERLGWRLDHNVTHLGKW